MYCAWRREIGEGTEAYKPKSNSVSDNIKGVSVTIIIKERPSSGFCGIDLGCTCDTIYLLFKKRDHEASSVFGCDGITTCLALGSNNL